MLAKGRTKRSRARSGKRKQKKSPHQRWLRILRLKYGAFDHLKPEGREYLLPWTTDCPPRMPVPSGPSPGATLTIVQQVNQFNDISGNVATLAIQQASALAAFGAIGFELADLAQVASWAAVFDQYRIEEVHFRLTTRSNAVSTFTNSAATEDVPFLLFVIDRDDSSALGSLNAMYEYDNIVQIPGTSNLDIILQPSVTPALYASGAFSGYGVEKSNELWLDVANTGVAHYGIKFGLSPLDVATTAKWTWDIMAWYKVSFRNVR